MLRKIKNKEKECKKKVTAYHPTYCVYHNYEIDQGQQTEGHNVGQKKN